ncbi:MAG: hypothetical protein IT305_31500 [Chloroflexi bacterium]|nr:hypothetical protein [Chloroflexota bacterium]
METPETVWGFCEARTCDVVYVGASGALIRKDELKTRVGVKETADPVPICYCWSFNEGRIIKDLVREGRSTVRDFIAAQVRDGRCTCETSNPSGRCCLGDVARILARHARERSESA